jgi:hypothetical protein
LREAVIAVRIPKLDGRFSPPDVVGDPYPLATFLKRLRGLSRGDAESIERRAETTGAGLSAEWDLARAVIDRAAAKADRSVDRIAGGTRASDAFALSPAGKRGYQLAGAAAQLTGQALAVRQLLDRSTWDVVRSPWIGVVSLPAWGESALGSSADAGEAARAELAAESMTQETLRLHLDGRAARVRTWAAPFANVRHDPRLLLVVAHPWMSVNAASTLLDVFAAEVARRKLEQPSQPMNLPPAALIDATGMCQGAPVAAWPGIVRERVISSANAWSGR